MSQPINSAMHVQQIAKELQLAAHQIEATIALLDEGATIPFIARYRKERTGSLDEVQLAAIAQRLEQLRELDKRKEYVLKTIDDQQKLTPELRAKIEAAETLTELEDLYLPYKPKRKTRATAAREKGLEPLADALLNGDTDPLQAAAAYVDAEKGVEDADAALAGARDIIAERINEEAGTRQEMRELFSKKGTVAASVISGKEAEGAKYKDYFDWTEPLGNAPSHRLLAMRRAEKEGIISLQIVPEEEDALAILHSRHVQNSGRGSEQIWLAAKDAYKRLLRPSMETEVRLNSKKKADEEAIHVFADNLRQLLLAAPLGQKATLALDPGFRTGCKLVVLNAQGKLLHNDTIYPNEPQKQTAKAGERVRELVQRFEVQAVAIGNGTASRETEQFVRSLKLPASVQVVLVNESGASIYSASEVARDEFPDHDLTVRGAVSIGRRLMDPLAELVKLDPKSIGVGQYQHDVDQTALRNSLDTTVESCVNAVGVELNTASKELLTYVSGLGPTLAQNIVNYRNENGPFSKRSELKKVPRLGAKAFEQAAGFLRIRQAKHPLDASAVHPERYALVEQMAKDVNASVKELLQQPELAKKIDLKKYVSDDVGLPTLKDIQAELLKPGRDPREQFAAFAFANGVEKPSDLREGMRLPGIVTNITDFGAFVDVGVHQDGLVHLSQMADRFIKHPTEVVKVQQQVMVTVVSLDLARNRIGLSMKSEAAAQQKQPNHQSRNSSNSQQNTAPRPQQRKQAEQAPQTDLAAQLEALKGKFKN